jgi:ketosteroid isomerase-like protein
MSLIKISLSWLLACALLAAPAGASNAQTTDETALRNLVTQYFGAYTRKDADALKAIWSEQSPDAAQSLKYLQRVFAAAGEIDLAGSDIVRLEIDGDKAYVRAALELNVRQAKTGSPVPGFGKMNRALRFVREGGAWKLWREVSYEQEVSARLTAANSDAERRQLLAQ